MSIPTIAESKQKIKGMGWSVHDFFYEHDEYLLAAPIGYAADAKVRIDIYRQHDEQQAYAELAAFIEEYCKKVWRRRDGQSITTKPFERSI